MRPLIVTILLAVFCCGCRDKEEPGYPAEPHIEFVSVEFDERVDSGLDSLKLVLFFTDGDNDFGLDNTDLTHRSDPYHMWHLFQENGEDLDTLSTLTFSNAGSFFTVLNIDEPEKGKLVFPRTRKKQGHEDLPVYHCASYEYFGSWQNNVLVNAEDAQVLDASTTIIETLLFGTDEYYSISDTLLAAINRDHFNIEVDFLVDSGNGFEIFDWRKEFCTAGFHGRVFANCASTCVSGPFKVKKFNDGSGELTYSMTSIGFTHLFTDKKLKLRISIKDRALHKSNVIETPEFRLSDI